jgi:hypothetical protein
MDGDVISAQTKVYASRILADNGVTGRCLRKWVSAGRFPKPDGNLNGRNFWLTATCRAWEADVLNWPCIWVLPAAGW